MSELTDPQFGKSEIERKYLIDSDKLPYGLTDIDIDVVEQVYFQSSNDDFELRIRRGMSECMATLKGPGTEFRSELEMPISYESYAVLSDLSDQKIRKVIGKTPEGFDLRLFKDEHMGLNLVEVEFMSEPEMDQFLPPAWFGYDVTDDNNYYSRRVAEKETKDNRVDSHELEEFMDTVQKMSQDIDRPFVVGVAGPTAAGKSYVTDAIKSRFEDNVATLTLDDYCRGLTELTRLNGGQPWINWDLPIAYDLSKACLDIKILSRLGESITKPVYDFKSAELESKEKIYPKHIIIVDGLYALSNELYEVLDLSVYVDAPLVERVTRRIVRDSERTEWKSEEIFQYIMDVAEPAGQKYVVPQKSKADYCINTG